MASTRIDNFVFEVAAPPSFISGIVCICTVVGLMKNSLISREHIRTNVLALTYGSIGCYSLSMIIFSVGNVFLWLDQAVIGFLIISIFTFFYTISQVLIYWLLIFRVYHTFKESIYYLSKCTYIFFAILVILFFILSMLAILYNYLVIFDPSKIPKIVLIDLGLVIACGREIIDFAITVYLVALFIRKLLKVTVDINDRKIDVVESGLVQLDESQDILLNVMTRFFVLTLFATLSTQTTIFMGTLSLVAQQLEELDLMVHAFAVHWWLITVDCAINSICLYLMLEANKKQYNLSEFDVWSM